MTFLVGDKKKKTSRLEYLRERRIRRNRRKILKREGKN
jgi:hypothetical protein